VRRREALLALASLAALGSLLACGGSAATKPATPTPTPLPPLHLDPVTDLVAAAGLVWLVDARPRDIFGELDLIPALGLVMPEANLDAFATDNGGVDLRQVTALAYARYPDATLAIARGVFDPPRIEKTFTARLAPLDGRANDDGRVLRLWGTAGGERQQVAVFGQTAVALERGKLGPLRAAEAFAAGRLKRAKPALRADPLSRAAELLGDAPLRAFAPGPFDAEGQGGALGGLLAASTAVAASATPAGATPEGHAKLSLKLALLGAWGDDAPRAAERLGSVWSRLGTDPFGRLCGVDKPLDGPKLTPSPDAVTLEATLDALAVARGIHDLTSANVREIMAY
jgi:hypothetical protein